MGEHSDKNIGLIIKDIPIPIPTTILPKHKERDPLDMHSINGPIIMNISPIIMVNLLPILSAIKPVRTAATDNDRIA